MGKYNFKEDLQNSEESVDKVINFLQHMGCTDIEKNNDGRYDISYVSNIGNKKTAEVKNDLMYGQTGNVVIEYESRGKPSGISTSKADNWYYVLGDDIYFCETGKLRVFLIQHWDRFRRVVGGDNKSSKLILISLEVFKSIFYLV